MADKYKMNRGVQKALYKYLPGCWVDFTQSGGGLTYAVHVDRWNSVPLTGVNNKRLLRVVSQRVHGFADASPHGAAALANFPHRIDTDSCSVLTPRSDAEQSAIFTSVEPLVFVCSSCGRFRQFTSQEAFHQQEHEPCACGNHMTQLRIVAICKCGHAEGIHIPDCPVPGHGTESIVRRGSGLDFICTKCGKRVPLNFRCPKCGQKMDLKPALDSAQFFPFSLSLIDLLDKRKDVFLDKEADGLGEKVILAQYLGLISQQLYEGTIANGAVTGDGELEERLQREAEELRAAGLDEAAVQLVLDSKRKADPGGALFSAIAQVESGISLSSASTLKRLAEQIMEYDELMHAKVVLSLKDAEEDATLVRDGIRPDYLGAAKAMGFSNVRLCSGVPIVFATYGYTRKECGPEEGVRLRGFSQETGKSCVYATRLETEGVLFELDRERVLDWLLRNNMLDELDLPQDRSEYGLKLWFLDQLRPERIKPFSAIEPTDRQGLITKKIYTLLHSLSHALIGEASQICGLDKSSISEYILPNIPAVLLYCSNSQGFSMGALYTAFQTYFDRWMKSARENVKKCIFDPICISKEKACAGCLFLNEVSCQHFNKDLDRAYLCGYFDSQSQHKLTGYWEE